MQTRKIKRGRIEHTFTLVVSANPRLTRQQVAREVRTLISDQCNYLDSVPGTFDEIVIKAKRVGSVPRR
jgi:hypothetical protein